MLGRPIPPLRNQNIKKKTWLNPDSGRGIPNVQGIPTSCVVVSVRTKF